MFKPSEAKFEAPSMARILNTYAASIDFQTQANDNVPDGWYLICNDFRCDTSYFKWSHVGESVVITPTQFGLQEPAFMSLFNSFPEFRENDNEKTKRQRDLVYKQALAMFHNDQDGSIRDKLGWSRGPNTKQVLSSKIPEYASDAVVKKVTPPRRPTKPGIYFVGTEGSNEAAFLTTINHKASNQSISGASMFSGSFWDPSKEAEDKLELARSRLQTTSNCMMMSQAISDLSEVASNGTRRTDEYRDILSKIKCFSDENLRMLEPNLASQVNDYCYRKRDVRAQMVKGLAPTRVREPLINAPIFAEDTNIFPVSAMMAANQLAIDTPDANLVLPKHSRRNNFVNPLQKFPKNLPARVSNKPSANDEKAPYPSKHAESRPRYPSQQKYPNDKRKRSGSRPNNKKQQTSSDNKKQQTSSDNQTQQDNRINFVAAGLSRQ